MFRRFTISAFLHCILIVGLFILSFISPRIKILPPTMIITGYGGTMGDPNKPMGRPPVAEEAPAEAPAPKPSPAPTAAPKKEEPAPTPAATPKPAATPAPPKPTHTPIVQPKKTPVPTPVVPVKKNPVPTLKKPAQIKKMPETAKKIVRRDKTQELVKAIHTPAPTPIPTPEPEPPAVVEDVTSNEQPVVPQERQVAEAPKVPPPPAITPSTGPGGTGAGQRMSPGHTIKGGIAVPGQLGNGGGSNSTDPGYGNGSILNGLAQTYFAIVLQRIEENFKLPYTRPGVQCMIQFMIEKDGTINSSSIKIIKPSGFTNLDTLAVQALEVTKLPPLYDGMKINSLPVILTFNYENKF